jgi:hypothetical protein
MGKWLSRVIDKGKSESKNYQDLPKGGTDRTDNTLESSSYESGWEKCFPVTDNPFWRKNDIRIEITGAELERLMAPRIEEAAFKEEVKNDKEN